MTKLKTCIFGAVLLSGISLLPGQALAACDDEVVAMSIKSAGGTSILVVITKKGKVGVSEIKNVVSSGIIERATKRAMVASNPDCFSYPEEELRK